MLSDFKWLALPAIAVFALNAYCAESEAEKPDAISQAIKQLGDNDFSVREAATRLLWEKCGEAADALKTAAASPDGEIAGRARRVLEDYSWGISPSTPEEVIEKIQAYRNADENLKSDIFTTLLTLGLPGIEAATRIYMQEKGSDRQQYLGSILVSQTGPESSRLIANGELAKAEQILEMAARCDNEYCVKNYSAFVVRSGRAKATISQLRSRRELDEAGELLLAFLLRAEGDLSGAKAAASKTSHKTFQNILSVYLGEWNSLAAQDSLSSDEDAIRINGRKATFYKLAQNKAKFDEAVGELRKASSESIEKASAAGTYLFINGCFENDVENLKGQSSLQGVVWNQIQDRAKHELDAINAQHPTDNWQKLSNAMQKASLQWEIGDGVAAKESLEEAVKWLRTVPDPSVEGILRLQVRAGMEPERICQFAAPYANPKPGNEGTDQKEGFWETLFPRRGQQGWAWWAILRELNPKEDPGALMHRMQKLFSPTGGPGELLSLLPDAEQIVAKWPPDRREKCHVAIVATLKTSGESATAERLLKNWLPGSDSAELLLGHADDSAERGEWPAAERAYAAAFESDRNPLSLFLCGASRVRCGKQAEGEETMHRARLMLLGDESELSRFAEQLRSRTWTGAAAKEFQFLERISVSPGGVALALYKLATIRAAGGDFTAAAELIQRANLVACVSEYGMLYPYYAFYEHIYRARQLIQNGKFDDVLGEVKWAFAVYERGGNDIGALVLELDRLGHKDLGDQAYAEAKKAAERFLNQDPAEPSRLNTIAWMQACCRRDLNEALEHAQRAMVVNDQLSYLCDTLAEVYFQLGQTQKAIELEERSCALYGLHRYYFKQLARFRGGNPATPVPEEDW